MWKVRACKLNMNIQRIQLMFSTNIERREEAWEAVKSNYMSACQTNVCNPKQNASRSDPQLVETGLTLPNSAEFSWIPGPILPVLPWKFIFIFILIACAIQQKKNQHPPCPFRKWLPVREMLKIIKSFIKRAVYMYDFQLKKKKKVMRSEDKIEPCLKSSVRTRYDQKQGNLSDIIWHFSAPCVKLKFNPKYFIAGKCHEVNSICVLRNFLFSNKSRKLCYLCFKNRWLSLFEGFHEKIFS